MQPAARPAAAMRGACRAVALPPAVPPLSYPHLPARGAWAFVPLRPLPRCGGACRTAARRPAIELHPLARAQRSSNPQRGARNGLPAYIREARPLTPSRRAACSIGSDGACVPVTSWRKRLPRKAHTAPAAARQCSPSCDRPSAPKAWLINARAAEEQAPPPLRSDYGICFTLPMP